MYRVTTHWQMLSGRQGVTVLHWRGGGGLLAQDAANATHDLWDALKGALVTSAVATVQPIVEDIAEETGNLTGLSVVDPGSPVAGTVSGQQAADATQFLIRWNTGAVANGRRVQGRTYLPGVPVGSLDGGNVKGTVLSSLRSTVGDWLSGLSDAEFVVYRCPAPGRAGGVTLVTGSDVWSELAVQRRRRTK